MIATITFSIIFVVVLSISLSWLAMIMIAKEKPKVKEILRAFENGITFTACVLIIICLVLEFS